MTESIHTLMAAFIQTFGNADSIGIARAPGRLNLLGEHTDYNGLPVLPMTINRDIRIAFAMRQDHAIRLANLDTDRPEATFENQVDIPPSQAGAWENYCKAAIQGLNQYFNITQGPGANMLVTGDIPQAAGISSSSALVVASALAYLAVLGKSFGRDINALELAGLLAEAEHYVGTRGGGMDQAIILMGREDMACKLDFFPLRGEHAPLLPGYVFVACNCLVKAPKTGSALHKYNEGPLTCRLMCALAEKQARQIFDDEIRLDRLGDLWFGPLCLTDAEVADLFETAFAHEHMSLHEAATFLGMEPERVHKQILAGLEEPKDGFLIRPRARHQLTEFQRVEAARDALLSGDALSFGGLMNASHESCAKDYRVSCPELDRLVQVARESGALGSRMTGAGFGGCTVSLVPSTQLHAFIRNVTHLYYQDWLGLPTAPSDAILPAHPTHGAGYLTDTINIMHTQANANLRAKNLQSAR